MKNFRRWTLAMLVAATAVLSACSSRHGLGGDNSDCDYLVVPKTGASVPDLTLACFNSDLSIDFDVNVFFLGPSEEDGGLGNPPDATSLSQFLLEHYDVTYRNLSDGGGTTVGTSVPRGFRRSVGEVFDLTQNETLAMTGFPVLLAGAKAEAPLNNSGFYPGPSGVVFEATITFWGHPVTDDNAWCYATLRYVFTVAPC